MHLLPPFFLCTNFSLFHISHLDMFLQTQSTTMKTKSKNKVTMLSFYTAKLKKKSQILQYLQGNGKKCDFCETLGHSKVCLKVIVLRISGYIKPYFGLSFGTQQMSLRVFYFHAISYLCGCVSFGPLRLH